MKAKDRFKKIAALFYYSPKDRKVFEGLEYIKTFKEKLNIPKSAHDKILEVKDHWQDLGETMTDTLVERIFNYEKYEDKINKILFHPLASKEDTINNKKVRESIRLALKIMESSKDPFHDISHIYRVMKVLKVYFSAYRLKHKLDWGVLVLAASWHDVSRVKGANLLKPLHFVPFMMDMKIILNTFTDAQRSARTFWKESEELDLDIREKVYDCILGTSLKDDHENIYAKILSDVDSLDMYTIGRVNASFENLKNIKEASIKEINRTLIYCSYLFKRKRRNLQMHISEAIFDMHVSSLDDYAQKFLPRDAEILNPKS